MVGGGSVVVDLLFIVAPIVCGGSVWSLFCYSALCVLSSFAIILVGEERAGCLALIVFLVASDSQ